MRSEVVIVHDPEYSARDVVASFKGSFTPVLYELDEFIERKPINAEVYIFVGMLNTTRAFQKFKQAIGSVSGEALFIFCAHHSSNTERMRSLRVADCLHMPVDENRLRGWVRAAINRQVERSWAGLEPHHAKALQSSLASFESMFERVARNKVFSVDDIRSSCSDVCHASRFGDLTDWIDALDSHHNYTFRHSMFVCGTITYFGRQVGFRDDDLERLAMSGLLHDIGKCRVPLEILDKPGRLLDQEWELMRLHPEHSRRIFQHQGNLDPDIVAGAVHHHERLDGNGYPDGLRGAEISDFVRLITIADVYSALIDKRVYKAGMSKEQAVDMMMRSKGHMDNDLVRVFREYILDLQGSTIDKLEQAIAC